MPDKPRSSPRKKREPQPRTKSTPTTGGGRRPARPKSKAAEPRATVRLQKVMADAGLGSRRACEEMIEEGRVRVNNRTVRELPVLVNPETDRIEFEGQPLPTGGGALRHIYVMLYKPRQTVTTLSDPAGRRTVADLVRHPSGARLYPVGRLDYDTMGLLLMTNDGELANRLTHPRYEVHKHYRAVVKGGLTDEQVSKLEKGVYLAERRDGKSVGVSKTAGSLLKIAKNDPNRTILDLTLKEGRNRQVRRMLAKAGAPVKKLVRIQMGPLKLKGLALGQWRELTLLELQSLRKAAGLSTTRKVAKAGAPQTAAALRAKTASKRSGKR